MQNRKKRRKSVATPKKICYNIIIREF